MNGRFLLIRRKLGVAAGSSLLAAALGVACDSSNVEPGQTQGESEELSAKPTGLLLSHGHALEVIGKLAQQSPLLSERFSPLPEVVLRRHGDRLLPRLGEGSPALALGLELAASSGGRSLLYPIENPEQHVALTPLRSREVDAEVLEDGRVLYPDAFTGTDLIVTTNHNRLVHTLVLHSEQSPADFRWQLGIAPGLRKVESSRNETSLIDAKGHLRLTFREVSITLADGSLQHTSLVLDPSGTASLLLPRDLSYPAVAQFEIEAPPVALALIPPEIIKARMMVLVDTSGSMMYSFNNDTNQHGDGDGTSVFCDNGIGTGFACNANVACSLSGGTPGLSWFPANDPTGNPSRMLGTKRALQNVFNAHSGLIDFGLMRYRESSSDCASTQYCCTTRTGSTTVGRCTDGASEFYSYLDGCTTDPNGCDESCNTNADGRGNDACTCDANGDCDGGGGIDSDDNDCIGGVCRVFSQPILTYSGSCGSSGAGGRVLVQPTNGSAPQVRSWVDFVEDFCSSTGSAGGAPRNPELRADGATPLAWSIDTARTDWYQPAYDAWDDGNTGHALYDDKFDCRPYVLVAMTDGDDTCAADSEDDPPAAVTALRNVSPVNPITIYTMGMGNAGGLNTDVLDDMMQNGGSGETSAPIAGNQQEIEAAFADIVAETVKFEVCNAQDDNCNNRIDEGLNVYQECATSADCGSTCDQGRCACTTDSHCDEGYSCAADNFCRPACTVGAGLCRNSGIRKCGSTGGQCCVDDGQLTCTPLSPLPPGIEVCNRIDDDCDGLIDEDFPDGCPVCIPRAEVCNGIDDDCDGLVDNDDGDLVGIGAPCGTDEGACTAGTINCVDGTPVCEDEVEGSTEVCNGVDDNCDGKVDGQTQACYTGPDGTEDVGVCHGGTQACVATGGSPGVPCTGNNCWGACVGEVVPSLEICDGLDNDCDGDTDEGVPAAVQPCEDHDDCLGSNNCVNNACRCNAGDCSDDFECGGDGICHPATPVTGDDCCQDAFAGLCGVGVCQFGTWECSGNQVSCVGGSGPSDEICDGLDNDCDGETDEDLPGVGQACIPDDGECGGELQCVVERDGDDMPIGGAIVCVPTDGGSPEVCDGIDNDCDGAIDERPDIVDNDPGDVGERLGEECNFPPEDMQEGDCGPGTWDCVAGQVACVGDTQPGTEVCNGVDDDCDGEVDEGTCPEDGGRCIDGVCRYPCAGGEFPCPPGEVCVNRFCIPEDEVETTTSGSTTTGSGGSASGSGGSASGSGGASGGSGGEDTSSAGGSGGEATGGATGSDGGTSAGGTSASNVASTTTGGDDFDKVYGLASGGGGCSCRITESRLPGELALLFGLVTTGGILRRRRASRHTAVL